MHSDDIESAIEAGNVRPARETVWAMAWTPGAETIEVDGIGRVKAKGVTDSGLILASDRTAFADDYRAELFIVVAIGNEGPEQWSWADAGLEEFVAIAVRPIAGIETKGSRFRNFKWTEIMAIGNQDEAGVPMLPAPGYVLLQMDDDKAEDERGGVLVSNPQTLHHLGHRGMRWGTVLALPKCEWTDPDEFGMPDKLAVGDRVAVPYGRHNGATEWLEAEDGMKVVPLKDVMLREEAS